MFFDCSEALRTDIVFDPACVVESGLLADTEVHQPFGEGCVALVDRFRDPAAFIGQCDMSLVIYGPIDLVASRYGVFCQGCDEVALTLLDVLDYMEKIPMVTAYKLSDGTTTTRFPMGEALDTAQPVVEYLPGWHCDITAARKWEDLPKEAQNYVEYLEKAVGCKITYISVGAEREAYIHHVV